MTVSRNRDIARFLGKTEKNNTSNFRLTHTGDGSGLVVYATKENLPTTGLTSGDQAFVTNTSRLYISNGSGWYNVALINATPSLTISPTGAIELSTAGATTTITLTATDSDNAVAGLTFSVDSDGSFGGLGTISQDSSVFTITPFSEDSATTTSSTLTFKASDGISFGSGQSAVSLTFSVPNSKFTELLLQADTSSTDNQVDISSAARTVTEGGNVTSSAWTPYHPGGYSNYVPNSPQNYSHVSWNSPPTFSATAWCVETWFKPDGMPSVAVGATGHWSIFGCWDAYNNNKEFLLLGGSSGELRFYYSFDGSAAAYVDSASGKFSANTWVHLAVSFDGTNYTVYADGVNVARVVNSTQIANKTAPLSFGKSIDGAGNVQTYVAAWYADGRVINGSTLETNNTFPVPTKRIDTSVANTQAVFHNKPHPRQSLTYGGDATIKRDGPYNHLPYTKSEHGGSVYFDGSGDNLELASSADFNFGSTDWTIEAWLYQTARDGSNICRWYMSGANGNGNAIHISINTNGTLDCGRAIGGGVITGTSTATIPLNTWNHVVATKEGSNGFLYLNGEQVSTSGAATDQTSGDISLRIGYDTVNTVNEQFTGYMADLQIIKGARKYTGNFAPPTAPISAHTNSVLLTCTNKNDIWDASSGKLLTKAGNTTASNTQRKFATSSAVYFDGTGDYMVAASDDGFDHPGDFTWELWVYTTAHAGGATDVIMSNYQNSTNGITFGIFHNTGKLYFGVGGDANRIDDSGALPLNTWTHLAGVRSGSTVTFYVNGTSVGTTTNSGTLTSTSDLTIGTSVGGGSLNFTGYIQDVRITNGLARYTSAFTPPTAEFSG